MYQSWSWIMLDVNGDCEPEVCTAAVQRVSNRLRLERRRTRDSGRKVGVLEGQRGIRNERGAGERKRTRRIVSTRSARGERNSHREIVREILAREREHVGRVRGLPSYATVSSAASAQPGVCRTTYWSL